MKFTQDLSPRSLLVPGLVVTAVMILLGSAQNIVAQWNPSPSPSNNIYYNSGNVGIGTTAPAALLDAGGNSQASPAISARKSGNGLEFGHPNSGGYGSTIGGTMWSGFSFIAFNAENDAVDTYRTRGSIGRVIWNDHLVSKWNFGHLANGNASGQTPTSDMTIDQSGKVGIGTTSPGSRLHIVDLTAQTKFFNGPALGQLSVQGATGTDELTALTFISSAGYPGAKIAYRQTVNGGLLQLGTSNDYGAGITDTAVTIDQNGNVGIGLGPNHNPTQKLDVVGNINITGTGAGNITLTGTIHAKYQDVAEWVRSSEQIRPGTVVVLDAAKSNQVISSTQAYDTRVAGVVSERPGIALGESGANKVLVATTGRVLVKVDASTGPIHIGDLLVTSDIPGLAMKSEPITIGNREMHMPGTLIGKALEPLERGSGKILVLLSLQ